jgi:hypothetical protein
MSIYSITRPDDDIINDIKNSKKVLLVGCPLCANLMYSLQKKLPITKLGITGIRPIGMENEMKRISKVLKNRGYKTKAWVPMFPVGVCCGLNAITTLPVKLRNVSSTDIVVALCCEVGAYRLQSLFPSKKVVIAMNAGGIIRVTTKKVRGKTLLVGQPDMARFSLVEKSNG